jgi:multisubunit Na+/H+ antiporter MnhB subunit
MISIDILLIFMIIGAIIAVEVKNLLSSVIAIGAVGLGVSTAFLLLKAPDVAIVQLDVEILCVIIMIRATLKRDLCVKAEKRMWPQMIVALIFICLFLALMMPVLKELPGFGDPTMKVANTYIAQGVQDTGSVNLVASVILDYRAYDTLGEATILFTAVIGVLAIMRKKGRKEEDEAEEEPAGESAHE